MTTYKTVRGMFVISNAAPELSPPRGKLYMIVDNTNPNFVNDVDQMAQFVDPMEEFGLEAAE